MVRREIGVPSKWSLAARILAERRAILARLAVLDRRRAARTREWPLADPSPTAEVMEAVQESLAKDIELASREALVARLKTLARAEEKIRQGSYGRCDVCGQPIPPARLRALPEAVVCVACAEPHPARVSMAAPRRRSGS
jgi:RNA polymerase-binding transcription factor DksA